MVSCLLLCLQDNTFCLMAVLCSEFTMLLQHLFTREQVFTIPCAMSGNLRGTCTISAYLL